MKGSYRAHQDLIKEFEIAVSMEFPDLMTLPYTVGMFRDFDTADRIIHAGRKGVLDTIVMGRGFYLWFDCKTGNAVFTKEQKFFCERQKEINGRDVCFKLKSIPEALKIIRSFYEQK